MTALERIDHALGAVGALLDWALAVLRPMLPQAIAYAGRRSVRRVVDIQPETPAKDRAVITTSLLGATTVTASGPPEKSRGVVGVLAPELQFTLVTELGEAAARAGRSALALRLDQLSPIPVEEAAFAYRRMSDAGQTPVRVEVSIIRRESLNAATAQLSEMDADWRLVGGLSGDGQPLLEFKRSDRQPMGLGLKLLLVAAAVAAALFAWGGRFEQAAIDEQARQVQLTSLAREAARTDRQLDAVLAAHQGQRENPQVETWVTALAQTAEAQTPFTTIRITADQVILGNAGEPVGTVSLRPEDLPDNGSDDDEAADEEARP